MSSSQRGNFKMAYASVQANKWRSFLTMLGIIIGVVSVVTVVGIGQGVKHQVNRQIEQLGRDLITVRSGNAGGNLLDGNRIDGFGVLTANDLNAVQRTPGVRTAVPLSLVNGRVTAQGREYSPTVLGTTQALPGVLNREVAGGEFFAADTTEAPNVAVVGSNVARQLYQQRVPLGQTFELLGQTFYIRGVFAPFDEAPFNRNASLNDAILIPQTTAQTLTSNNAQIYEILARPDDAAQAARTASAVESSLRGARQGQGQFTVQRQDQSLAATNQILDLLTRLIAAVAAVSLLVGGIGIMNVMLASVAERMHEIGIRKALGATNRQILNQFMAESIVLSTIGGVLGVLFSMLSIFLVTTLTPLTPSFNWPVAGLAVVVSALVGVIFGTAPAIKAARKDPIQALRNE